MFSKIAAFIAAYPDFGQWTAALLSAWAPVQHFCAVPVASVAFSDCASPAL
jgi:hypothetical protein